MYNNPSSFDYVTYMNSKKINYQLVVNSYSPLTTHHSFYYMIKNYRLFLIHKNKELFGNNSILINSLALGHKDFSNATSDIINLSGISHVFAISGAHVLIIILILDTILFNLNLSSKKHKIIKISFLFLYIFLASNAYPIIRASFVEIALLITSLDKKFLTKLICVILLLLNPLAIHSLSFALTFLVSFLLPPLIAFNKQKKLPNYLIPIHFNYSLYFLLLPFTINLNNSFNLVTPIIVFISTFIISFVFLPLALFLTFSPFSFGLNYLLTILTKLFSIFINFSLHFNITIAHLTLPVIFILLLFIYYYFKTNIKIYRNLYFLTLIISLINFNIFGTISFIDVGQGDSIFIQSPFNGENILIDTGPPTSEDELIKFLHYKGISTIDNVLITHWHNDHYGNVDAINKEFTVKQFYASPFLDESLSPIPFNFLKADDTFIFNHKTITLLSSYHLTNNPNDGSLSFIMSLGGQKWYFGGDLESQGELDILAHHKNISSDYYKVDHHGSKTSSNEEFLDALNPKYAIITSSLNNNYNLPNPLTIEHLKKRGIKIYYTAQGLVEFKYTKNHIIKGA